MLQYFANNGINLNSLGVKSWAITSKGTLYWWTDQDISTMSAGEKVRVIRYNASRGTYTAGYATIGETTVNGSTPYNVIGNGRNVSALDGADKWTEYDGVQQDDASKASYEQTLAIFNSMPVTAP